MPRGQLQYQSIICTSRRALPWSHTLARLQYFIVLPMTPLSIRALARLQNITPEVGIEFSLDCLIALSHLHLARFLYPAGDNILQLRRYFAPWTPAFSIYFLSQHSALPLSTQNHSFSQVLMTEKAIFGLLYTLSPNIVKVLTKRLNVLLPLLFLKAN